MREWAIPFLRSKGDPNISAEELEREISVHFFACKRLTGLFNTIFVNNNERLSYLLGSVLGDLPSLEILEDIRGLNPFFIFPAPLAFVTRLNCKPFENPIVVILSKDLLEMNDSSARGCFAHEVAHLSLRHFESCQIGRLEFYTRLECEKEADILCQSWGFDSEIENIRNYISLKGGI